MFTFSSPVLTRQVSDALLQGASDSNKWAQSGLPFITGLCLLSWGIGGTFASKFSQ